MKTQGGKVLKKKEAMTLILLLIFVPTVVGLIQMAIDAQVSFVDDKKRK